MPDEMGAFADAARERETVLVQRLATSVELDRSFAGILRGAHQYNLQSRGRLDALEAEIRQAAAVWPALDTPAGARQFQAYLTGKTREIHKIVADAAADGQQRASQVQALTGRYPLGGMKRGGGPGEPLPGGDEPVSEYEQALRDAGLLSGPSPGGYYKQWLENAERRGVPPEEIVDIARQQHITPDSFSVLEKMEGVKDPDGKSFFLIPKGTSPAEMRKATLMTYILNAGTDYGAAPGTKDFKETPYSAAEVNRIANRQRANDGSYVNAWAMNQTGGRFVTTPNGMLMGLGGSRVADQFSQQGGTTYGDIFMVNIDHSADPAQQLRQIVGSGHSWYDVGGQPAEIGLDLDRVLHHEERHSQQWARLGTDGMTAAYLAEAARVKIFGGTNWFEKDAGLRDGGYE
ncbi:DUF4226 domain-containing protein [[Mycobacterium] nativiensis]|uniref:DUF4226 domain-containing protein n=1 Tax=[Mycobacterium] nativiensis TaxID=2855503 RepID=A0ABU5Y474_9MYCO|nr:DUF4226 domain-containing protein [Mycolicibacter sp. MYC340]MEB3035012.1 DUF4226 domain-containing protein [Mycolicibacter sp. MYC340]